MLHARKKNIKIKRKVSTIIRILVIHELSKFFELIRPDFHEEINFSVKCIELFSKNVVNHSRLQ